MKRIWLYFFGLSQRLLRSRRGLGLGLSATLAGPMPSLRFSHLNATALLCFLSALFCFPVFATNLQSAVNQIINQVDPSINMGIVVVDLDTGETLYQRNAERSFVPASNMKLFSDAAALLALGPDYHFNTQLTTDATTLDKGTLQGSLYLRMPGDPSFTQADVDKLLMQLHQLGIKRISGNVVIVSNNSIVDAYAPGRSEKDYKYSYGAPVAPLVLDDNSLTITVNPSYAAGQPGSVELSPANTGLQINNQVKTVDKGGSCGLDFNMEGDGQVTVRGCIGVGQWAVQQRIAVRNPLRYMQDLIRQRLTNLSIKLDGQVVLGSLPAGTLLLATHTSKVITQLMADTLKPSDNVYADSLYLHTAAKLNGSPLNWAKAQPVVKDFLQQQTGINLQNALLIDGSGLSRDNLITPLQTVELLRFLHDRFPLAYEYIAALPVAGRDGTLQRRFRKPYQQGLLRAKTGTMTGIISLSGYLYTANAHTLAFAIYINRTPGTKPSVSGRYRSLVESLCDFFLRQKPDNNRVAEARDAHVRVAFQQQPTLADMQRSRYARWRQLELAVKQGLRGQAVTVLYRDNQLVLKDNSGDINKVWSVLSLLSKKYAFSVALHGKSSPTANSASPHLLWVKGGRNRDFSHRTWVLYGTV